MALALEGVRILVWPWASHIFQMDVLAVILEARAHPAAVCPTFLATDAALSALQIYWSGEIAQPQAAVLVLSVASLPGIIATQRCQLS